MKLVSLLACLLFCAVICSGQSTPVAFNYSGVARDQTGNPIINQMIGIQINIVETDVLGPDVFTENHFVTTDAYGIFNLIIGAGNAQNGSLSEINWGGNNFFLEIAMDVSGGSNFQVIGISQLLSVPYALHARTAESLVNGGNGFSGDYNDLSNLPALSSVAVTGDYNDLINAQEMPVVPDVISAYINDSGYMTSDNDAQQFSVSISGDTLFLSNGNWVIVPGISEANYQQNGIYTIGAGVTDVDGNQYGTIIINGGEWMSENLRTTSYANGDPIPNVVDVFLWNILTSGAWAHYNHDDSYEYPYGKLYNWYAVEDTRNVCPVGWHVPTLDEWTQLVEFLGGWNIAGSKMKSIESQFWSDPVTDATNESGFNGLPGGDRGLGFSGLGLWCNWWTSTQFSSTLSRFVQIHGNQTSVGTPNSSLETGLSIRCKRD